HQQQLKHHEQQQQAPAVTAPELASANKPTATPPPASSPPAPLDEFPSQAPTLGAIPTPLRSEYASVVSSVRPSPLPSTTQHAGVPPRAVGVSHPAPRPSSRREGPALTGPVGTVNYRAPEVLIGSPSNRYYDGYAVDLWAVGCIAYELIVGELLLPGRGLTDMDALHRLLSILGAPYEPQAKLQWPQSSLISGASEAILAISEAQQKQLSKTSSGSSDRNRSNHHRDRSSSRNNTPFVPHSVLQRTISDAVGGEDGVDSSATALDFLLQFLKWNPLQRTSAKHALRHPWLTKTQPLMCEPSELNLPPTNSYSFLASRR
ncbi:serine-threonine protein kinase, putative, partial [Bodo saltans]